MPSSPMPRERLNAEKREIRKYIRKEEKIFAKTFGPPKSSVLATTKCLTAAAH